MCGAFGGATLAGEGREIMEEPNSASLTEPGVAWLADDADADRDERTAAGVNAAAAEAAVAVDEANAEDAVAEAEAEAVAAGRAAFGVDKRRCMAWGGGRLSGRVERVG